MSKYSDVAERMAKAAVKEIGIPVLVIHSDPTQSIRRFNMEEVKVWDVVKTHVPRPSPGSAPGSNTEQP